MTKYPCDQRFLPYISLFCHEALTMNSFPLYRDSAFLMNGIWKLMKVDWNHDWMIKSNVVWLTSDLYLYCNNAYREAGGDLNIFHRNEDFIYIIERAQRFCSYAIVLSHMKEPEFTFFHLAVFVVSLRSISMMHGCKLLLSRIIKSLSSNRIK